MSHERIAPIARTQHGLITTTQALDHLTPGQLDGLLRAGTLEPARRGVYRVAGVPDSWFQLLMAACLSRPGAYASFRAAAALWSFEGFEHDNLEITVPGPLRARLDGVVVHESRVWGPHHLVVVEQIPVSSVARTLCDLTAVVRPWRVERAVDEALRREVVTLRTLARVAQDLEGRGRRRCTVMRDILEHRAPGYHPGESDPEKRIAALLVRAGLPEPTRQHRVRVGGKSYRIDLSYPAARIAIEYDGWDFHKGRKSFDDDRARANDLVLLGFQVLRFTSKSSDDAIVDTVRAALARASVS
jgi:very-short-patch-repair endonuclease